MRILAMTALSLASAVALLATDGAGDAPRWTLQASGVVARLRGVSAVSPTVAWASGADGTVLRTVDGGTSWQRVVVPDAQVLDFRDVDAFDERTAYVLSIGPGEASRIYKTSDGGTSWTLQFINHDAKAFFDGMAFWSAERGLAVSDSVDGQFVIIRTENGGRTWTRVPGEGLPAALAGEGAFAASGTSVAVFGRDHAWIGTGASSRARVLRSGDGGRTWAVAPTPLPAGPSAGIFSIAFRNAQHGVIVGGDYKKEQDASDNMAVTRDGGASWTLTGEPALPGFRSAVAHLTSSGATLIAVGPSGTDVLDSDGRRWRPVGAEGFHAVSVVPGTNVAWAVGEKGAIGRLTWSADGMAPATPGDAAPSTARVGPQTQADDYTSYELLAPDTQQFRIVYDVTAISPGARYFFNPIRKGSAASNERVVDLASGAPLAFEVVNGARARAEGHPAAALDTEYIRVTLPRLVPARGEVRLRIDKTYKDAASYYREGDHIVFSRSLGIKRNKVVLPSGYELVGCNVPSQILTEADGHIAVSFLNTNPGAADLVVRARPLPAGRRQAESPATRIARNQKEADTAPTVGTAAAVSVSASVSTSVSAAAVSAAAAAGPEPSLEESAALRIADRAFQDREIVYFLQPPSTHAFDLFHDYTETRPGTSTYVNVVRTGSRVSNPSAVNLDTGEALQVETLTGAAIQAAKVAMTEPPDADTVVVVVRFPAVEANRSMRLRITETYTDPARYGLVDRTLVWRRSFGRPRNAIVLPDGWFPTASSAPATVSLTDTGRVRLDYVNARPDTIDVLVRALERAR